MSRLASTFSQLKRANSKAFIPFITVGDPSLEYSLKLMRVLVKNGADIIELGVPFSDPTADGITIQRSYQRALLRHTSLVDVLSLVVKFRKTNNKTPVVIMGYTNPIEAFGYERFAVSAKESGVDGVLVIDTPLEEALELDQYLSKHNLDLIFLIAPTTTDVRLAKLANKASGFVYFVSLKGVTGAKILNINTIKSSITKIRKYIKIPLGVGFGIKDSKTAATVANVSDAVIVGSSLVFLVEKYASNKSKMLLEVANKAKKISSALRR